MKRQIRRDKKPKVLIIANKEARRDPSSPLLRFVRDYTSTLKNFEIHATAGTWSSILSTGVFFENDIERHRPGSEGGVVEVAAKVVNTEFQIVIFLSDPKDPKSDFPENNALQRVCKELKIRLITTFSGAVHWARYEAEPFLNEFEKSRQRKKRKKPANWKEGKKNVSKTGQFIELEIEDQTIAIISHDKKKEEAVIFVNEHEDFLNKFDRILTTGTTGYLLKLLFTEESEIESIKEEANKLLNDHDRFRQLMINYWTLCILYCDQKNENELKRLKNESKNELETLFGTSHYRKYEDELLLKNEVLSKSYKGKKRPILKRFEREFIEKIMPLPSGPKGGDILIANEVLNNLCHNVIFGSVQYFV